MSKREIENFKVNIFSSNLKVGYRTKGDKNSKDMEQAFWDIFYSYVKIRIFVYNYDIWLYVPIQYYLSFYLCLTYNIFPVIKNKLCHLQSTLICVLIFWQRNIKLAMTISEQDVQHDIKIKTTAAVLFNYFIQILLEFYCIPYFPWLFTDTWSLYNVHKNSLL